MTVRFILLCWLCFCSLVIRAADTHYVATNALSVSPYANWTDAASNIQWAVDASTNGDTVLVSNGVYDTGGRVTPEYNLTNRVCVTNAITLRSVNGPAATVIKGKADDVTHACGDRAIRCVYLTNSSSLIGFTLTNGYTGTNEANWNILRAGGVWIAQNCVVSNCIIIGNRSWRAPGGVILNGSNCFLNNCQVLTNVNLRQDADTGGIMISEDGNKRAGTVNNCTVAGNAAAYAAGVGMRYGTMNNCIISNNTAGYNSAGIYIQYGGTLNNCVVVENRNLIYYPPNPSMGQACGIYVAGSAAVALNNCTVVNNIAFTNGGGVGIANTNTTMNNCIVWGNTCSYNSYSNIYIAAGVTSIINNTCSGPAQTNWGSRNIGSPPLLADTNSGNYRLTMNSPCVNTGTNQSWMTNAIDLDGRARIHYGTVDMGAYEIIYDGTVYILH